MVQRCCVPFCDTKVGDGDINGVKVRFHRIPLTPEKILKWRNQITKYGEFIPEPELTVNSRVCSKHFLRSDYITVDNQKPGTAGNHVLTSDAVPTVFKWNDATGNDCEVSMAVPFAKKSSAQEDPTKNQEIQCSIEEDKLKQEIFRKNLIIRQLLQRLAELEGPQESSNSQNMTIPNLTNKVGNQPDVAQDILRNNCSIVTVTGPDIPVSEDIGVKRKIIFSPIREMQDEEPPRKVPLFEMSPMTPMDLSLK